MRLRRQELPTPTLNNDIMEDSGGMTPAMYNNSKNKKSLALGQHCNAIVSLRFVMAISLIFVGGFTRSSGSLQLIPRVNTSSWTQHIPTMLINCMTSRMYSLKRRPVGSPYPADSFSSNIWAMNKLRTDIES